MDLRYKYLDDIKDITDCPPTSCTNKNMTAFRFVFELNTENDWKNFLPSKKISPQRTLRNDKVKCSGYGLSFFDSENNAKMFYETMRERNDNIHKSIGTHLAKVSIDQNDGVVTEINNRGHFDLHEYENTNWSHKFEIIAVLYNPR
ncbi:hypothetical protein PN471_10570 [Aphanizomenon sp. CS-733/32]|uniref:hypothetical protein n=1 Tax=Aphanizomenon sp. CS-733/32 TaxID=3021715 RepID=UPI0023302175|nr:hypothetical protein [Aphanizomenon sp. CS-733/32]MDB9309075.1 hypothetical protein [Aphanizomenon sp. CS-733/32]